MENPLDTHFLTDQLLLRFHGSITLEELAGFFLNKLDDLHQGEVSRVAIRCMEFVYPKNTLDHYAEFLNVLRERITAITNEVIVLTAHLAERVELALAIEPIEEDGFYTD